MSLANALAKKLRSTLEQRYGDSGDTARRQIFDAYDENGDGGIDAGELRRLLADAGVGNAESRGYWVSGVFVRMDRNGDGLICFDEFSLIVDGEEAAPRSS